MIFGVRINFSGAGPAYTEWLESHPDDYVIVVAADFGPDGPVRLADGTIDFHPESLSKVLHRVACDKVKTPGSYDTSVCGTREELERELSRGGTLMCQVCQP